MRIRKILTAGALAASALLPAGAASAAVVTFENIVGSWSNISGGSGVSYAGNGSSDTTVKWGTPSGQPQQSGYRFQAVTSPTIPTAILPPSPSNDLVLGTFTHFNFPISGGTGANGVRLTISANVKVDGVLQSNYSFVYDFTHNETTNSSNPCANGAPNGAGVNVNGCADQVTMNYNALSDSFLVNGDLYTLDIRGFELLDATKVFGFWTTENLANSAYILGRVALTREVIGEVPLPATALLLGAGLFALGAFKRRSAGRG